MDLSRFQQAIRQGCVDAWAASVHWKDSPSPPPAPDYVGAAEATNTSQRVNQVTPYGNLTYTPGTPGTPGSAAQDIFVGSDPNTGQAIYRHVDAVAPTAGTPWTSQVTLTPQAQSALDSQLALSSGMGNLATSYLPNVQQSLSKPFDMSSVQDVSDQAYGAQTARLDPQWQQNQQQFDAKMSDQGIPVGSEAYDNANREFQQSKNDAYSQARLTSDQLMPQTFQIANAAYSQPLNTLNAIRSGAQVQNPQFSPNGAGANILGATQAQGQYAQGIYGSDVAATNAANQQTGQMAALAAMMMMGSDRRLKEEIRRVGQLPSGIPLYTFRYKGEPQYHLGVMADEVLPVIPEAVAKRPDGYYAVNYGMLR